MMTQRLSSCLWRATGDRRNPMPFVLEMASCFPSPELSQSKPIRKDFWILITYLILCWPLLFGSPDCGGTDSCRALKVCWGIWHQDGSSWSFKSCKLQDEASVDCLSKFNRSQSSRAFVGGVGQHLKPFMNYLALCQVALSCRQGSVCQSNIHTDIHTDGRTQDFSGEHCPEHHSASGRLSSSNSASGAMCSLVKHHLPMQVMLRKMRPDYVFPLRCVSVLVLNCHHTEQILMHNATYSIRTSNPFFSNLKYSGTPTTLWSVDQRSFLVALFRDTDHCPRKPHKSCSFGDALFQSSMATKSLSTSVNPSKDMSSLKTKC